jgi:alpha-aminoadipate carrier protein LysW
MNAACPECDAQVDVAATAETGEILPCPECGVELEVMATAPLRLEAAPPEEEDWGE